MNEMTEGKALSIGFTGDFSFSGYYCDRFHEDLFSDDIKDFFAANEANVLNFESPVTPCRVTEKDYLAHRSDPRALEFVKANVKNPILSFANNHMMDYEDIGVVDTIEYTAAAGIPIIGMGMNLEGARQGVIVGNGIKVGIFAFQYKNNRIAAKYHGGPLHESSIGEIKKTIGELKQACDYVVAVYHGGDEFVSVPLPYTRKLLKKILGFGADVVVAHHPHVVQGYEAVDKKIIFYSLGNFLFDTDYQRAQENTDVGALLRLVFYEKGIGFEMVPTRIDRSTGKVTAGEECKDFRDMKEINYFQEWCRACLQMKRVKARKQQHSEHVVTAKKVGKGKKIINMILSDRSSIQKKMTQIFGAFAAKYLFLIKTAT